MKSKTYTSEHAKKGLAVGLLAPFAELRAPAGDSQMPSVPEIEVFENQYPNYEIKIEIPEFTSICPKTGLPDFGVIVIRYVPNRWIAELKALKLYINAYRNLGIFQENAVNRILRDFVSAVRPIFCEVAGDFSARGGLKTKVLARYGKEPVSSPRGTGRGLR